MSLVNYEKRLDNPCVLVMNGGSGLTFRVFFSTLPTQNDAPSRDATTARASASRVSLAFLPSMRSRRASNSPPRGVAKTPSIVQNSSGTNASCWLACELSMKMKEMSLTHAEAYHPMEFRHGPMSMVNAQTLIIGLVSELAFTQEVAVLKQMHEREGRILAIAAPLVGWSRIYLKHHTPLQILIGWMVSVSCVFTVFHLLL